MKLIALILLLFGGIFAEVFILDLQLKSVDHYISSLKYTKPTINNSADLLYNDEDNVGSEPSLVPSDHSVNETELDNETQTVLSDMYTEDYTFNSSEYNHVKDL